MKVAPRCLLVLLFALANGRGEPATSGTVPQVRIEVQMVALPKAKAVALLPRLRREDQIDTADAEIKDMIARKEAELIAWPEVTTLTGQRATTEDIQEVRYSTDVPAEAASKEAGAEKAQPKYETRNAGVTLEVDPTVSPDGKMIDLTIVPQQVRLLGWRDASIKVCCDGKTTTAQQPLFSTMKVTTSLNLRSGQKCLLGSFQIPGDDKQMELFILQAEVVGLDAKVPPTRFP